MTWDHFFNEQYEMPAIERVKEQIPYNSQVHVKFEPEFQQNGADYVGTVVGYHSHKQNVSLLLRVGEGMPLSGVTVGKILPNETQVTHPDYTGLGSVTLEQQLQ